MFLDMFIVVFSFFILMKMSTNNHSQKSVVLESSVKPGQRWKFGSLGLVSFGILGGLGSRFVCHLQISCMLFLMIVHPTAHLYKLRTTRVPIWTLVECQSDRPPLITTLLNWLLWKSAICARRFHLHQTILIYESERNVAPCQWPFTDQNGYIY